MLLSFPELVDKHKIRNVYGVLHVGAHLAEEAGLYNSTLGPHVPVWWVEANPRVQDKIKQELATYPNQYLIEALVYEADGVELKFNVTNYDGMSSSILEFGTHTQFSPDTKFVETFTLPSRRIDSLVQEHGIRANFLNMDIQGAEFLALSGALEFLKGVDYIITEVNNAEVYVDCARVEDLDVLLATFDLRRVETYWVPGQGWGDALYVRKHG